MRYRTCQTAVAGRLRVARARWAGLLAAPLDGQGLRPPADPDLAILRRRAAALQWRRLPAWLRGPGRLAARVLWLAGAVLPCRRLARGLRLPAPAAARLLGDCWAGGVQPVEAFVWRGLFGAVHPLPARAAGQVLLRLGDPEAHRLLADKLAAAAVLAAAGLSTPPVLARLAPGAVPDLAAPPWRQAGRLIAKPRRGSAGRGVVALDVAGDGTVLCGARRLPDAAALALLLHRAAGGDEVLVQERLQTAAALADLAPDGQAPVLRLTAAREPGGAPFLHSALLEIAVPGEDPRHFLRGRVRAPVDPGSGRLRAGLSFRHPERRLARAPWGAPLAGRAVPGFPEAVAAVLRAMAALPGLPLAAWDVIVTEDGPVILEGNSAGDWILTELSRTAGLSPPPLAPLLRLWAGG